jgi:hypothetical protein
MGHLAHSESNVNPAESLALQLPILPIAISKDHGAQFFEIENLNPLPIKSLSLVMEGYSNIAHLMGDDPGLAIFRRFRALNMQRLLYLQAELVQLEEELNEEQRLDHSQSQDPFRSSFSRSWTALKLSANEKGSGQQWKKTCEVQEKIQQYCIKYQFFLFDSSLTDDKISVSTIPPLFRSSVVPTSII